MSSLIYVADSDVETRQVIQSFLEKEGFTVECFDSNTELLEAFKLSACDLVVLDIFTNGVDGFLVSAQIRQLSDCPIITITCNESDENYIFGISIGIDVYLTKPFNPAKLVAHVRALCIRGKLLRALPPAMETIRSAILEHADITIDTEQITAFCAGKELTLTNTEFRMLAYMLENPNRALRRTELLGKVWGENYSVGLRAVDDVIKRLRRKLGQAQSTLDIQVVWGIGFRLRKVDRDNDVAYAQG